MRDGLSSPPLSPDCATSSLHPGYIKGDVFIERRPARRRFDF
jgi:hypothetical protein